MKSECNNMHGERIKIHFNISSHLLLSQPSSPFFLKSPDQIPDLYAYVILKNVP